MKHRLKKYLITWETFVLQLSFKKSDRIKKMDSKTPKCSHWLDMGNRLNKGLEMERKREKREK